MVKIAVFGLGYVGCANAVLLATTHQVTAVDLNPERVGLINQRISPLVDTELIEYLSHRELDLQATTDTTEALSPASGEQPEFVIIATPTNYDPDTDSFDTSSVESVLAQVAEHAPGVTAVIKSTIPIGFTARMAARHPEITVLFSPEFLREGRALYDNLHPSRVIVSTATADEDNNTDSAARERAEAFAALMANAAAQDEGEVPVLITGSAEAEAIKLFSNTYLAMRVAFFNELDSFAIANNLNTAEVIRGVSLDPRIGDHYNNPSFGYGGYCLPKDTKQLRANFAGVPQKLMDAIVDSNTTRMDFITDDIAAKNPKVVGVHRLAMKAGSDNFRSSAISTVLEGLADRGIDVIIYEPTIQASPTAKARLENDLETFLASADVVVTNRVSEELAGHEAKIYSRDIYGRD